MAEQHAAGTTVTFGTSGFTATILTISGGGIERQSIDVTPLSQNGGARKKKVHPYHNVKPYTITYFYDPSFSTFPPSTGAAEDITFTSAVVTGGNTAAKEVGSGYVINEDLPTRDVNDSNFMVGSMTIEMDSTNTAWTRTAETTPV